MDRVTQLQDAIDKMAEQFVQSIHHLHHNALFVKLNPRVEVTIRNPETEHFPEAKFKESQRELAADIAKRAKEIEILIDALPGVTRTEDEQIELLQDLERQMHEANREYEEAIVEAESLLAQVNHAIRVIADDHSAMSEDGLHPPEL